MRSQQIIRRNYVRTVRNKHTTVKSVRVPESVIMESNAMSANYAKAVVFARMEIINPDVRAVKVPLFVVISLGDILAKNVRVREYVYMEDKNTPVGLVREQGFVHITYQRVDALSVVEAHFASRTGNEKINARIVRTGLNNYLKIWDAFKLYFKMELSLTMKTVD